MGPNSPHWCLSSEGADDADPDTAAGLRAVTVAEEQAHRDALIAAPHLDDDEAAALERKPARTDAETVLLEAHRIRQILNVPAITPDVLDFWDRGAVVRRLDRFDAARGIVPDRDEAGDTLARRRFWRAVARGYAHIFDGIDIADGEWLDDATAGEIVARVMKQRHLLAHMGIVGPKFAVWNEDREGRLLPMQTPAYPVREVVDILARPGLATEGRRVRRCPTWPGTILSISPACGTPKAKGNPRAHVYKVTAESWEAMQAAADLRNVVRRVTVAPIARPVVLPVGRVWALIASGERKLRCA